MLLHPGGGLNKVEQIGSEVVEEGKGDPGDHQGNQMSPGEARG